MFFPVVITKEGSFSYSFSDDLPKMAFCVEEFPDWLRVRCLLRVFINDVTPFKTQNQRFSDLAITY